MCRRRGAEICASVCDSRRRPRNTRSRTTQNRRVGEQFRRGYIRATRKYIVTPPPPPPPPPTTTTATTSTSVARFNRSPTTTQHFSTDDDETRRDDGVYTIHLFSRSVKRCDSEDCLFQEFAIRKMYKTKGSCDDAFSIPTTSPFAHVYNNHNIS